MQRHTHKTLAAPRFFINGRGVLMDRQATGTARRTGYSMVANRATRSEMQILADLLNTPEATQRFDSGWSPNDAWAVAIDRREQDMKRGMVSVAASSGAWNRFVIAPPMQEACCAA